MKPPGQASSKISYSKLFRWARFVASGAWPIFIGATAVTVINNLLTQYNVQLLSNLITQLSQAGSGGGKANGGEGGGFIASLLPDDLQTAAIVFAILGVGLIALTLLNRVMDALANTKMLLKLQQALHDKMMSLGMGYHSEHDLGENTAIVMQYSNGAQPMLRDLLAFPVVRGISLVSAMIFLIHNLSSIGDTPVWLQLLLAGLVIILPIGGWWLSSKLRAAFADVMEIQGKLNNELVNSISAPQEVQLMGAIGRRSRAFAAQLARLSKAKIKAALKSEISNQFQNATPTLLQTALLIYAVFFVIESGSGEVGAILAIYYFVPKAIAPIQEFTRFYAAISSAWPNIEKIGQVLDSPLEVQDRGTRSEADLHGTTVKLEGVADRYSDDGPMILKGIDHAFAEGSVTSIVGRSGSGKSSILRLIARLRDPREGHVSIGGVPVTELKMEALRGTVGAVSQFPLFLEDTLRANMQLAVPEATDQEIEEACKKTGLWAVLQKLQPDAPLEVMVSRTAGKGLSGGERRLLAITRALLGKPEVLLLDEPTTGIDAMSLESVMKAVEAVKDGHTTILIDHNLDVVKKLSDQIVCLEDGKFTAVGAPDELLRQDTLFTRLMASKAQTGEDGMQVVGTVPLPDIKGGGGPKGSTPGQPTPGQGAGQAPDGAPKPGGPPPSGAPRRKKG